MLVLPALVLVTACAPTRSPSAQSSLYVFRLSPPALIELGPSLSVLRTIPLAIPEGCGLQSVHAPRRGAKLALEVSCPFGEAVLTVDTLSGAIHQPVTDSDSHFLAWSADGSQLYLKVNSINRPQIIRVNAEGIRTDVPVSELTYDLSPNPDNSGRFMFALSRGMGLGSELWMADEGARSTTQLAVDPTSYLSLARWSPDGKSIAFIQIPDSPTPYTVGQLWVMQADGSDPHMLAEADAGHGFAPSWSPDGSQIAFTHRDNPDDQNADESAGALISNIHVVSVVSGKEEALTTFRGTEVEGPAWQPDGGKIAFTAVLNDKMSAYVLDVSSGSLRSIDAGPACCAAWVQR